MILKNGNIFYNEEFRKGSLIIEDGFISDIRYDEITEPGIDCTDKYIIPGLVDIHTHGCVGFDFSTATSDEIHKMRKYYFQNGITSVLAATVTLSDNDIKKAVNNIAAASDNAYGETDILGINIEGPYLSEKKCGAHDISLLKEPDLNFINSLGDIIKIVNIAPEYSMAFDFIKNFNGKVSVAHTDCDYDTAMEAIKLGADHITHIFNAMNGLHHRKPGVIGAFFDTDAYAEMICDSIHIHDSILRMMFTAKPKNIAIISDSMAATGLKDGKYKLGNLDVTVRNSTATLEDGTLAGSVMNVYKMMQNLIKIGIKPEKAVASATMIPADSINMGDKIGHIEIGRNADLVIANKDFSLNKVIQKGITS